jgi:phosphohistidine phosphatase
MLHLYLIRHAKSSWEDAENIPDIDRPLNKRGLRDAPRMAEWFGETFFKHISTENLLLCSSPARRAWDTCAYFADYLKIPCVEVLKTDALYEHSTDTSLTLQFLQQLNSPKARICIFGHNPTFTEFANLYARPLLENIPTCGIAHIGYAVENWKDISAVNGQFLGFYYPKML